MITETASITHTLDIIATGCGYVCIVSVLVLSLFLIEDLIRKIKENENA